MKLRAATEAGISVVLAHGEHVRMKVDVSRAGAGHGEGEADHRLPFECAHDLASDLVGHHKHAQRYKLGVGKVPHFFLQGHAGAELLDVVTAAQFDGVRGQAVFPSGDFSVSFAFRQSDSSSSVEASPAERPSS